MATAARRTTALVPSRRRSRAPAKRRATGGGASPARKAEAVRTRTLTLGGLTAFGFGLLQSKVALPSIPNVPDSLTYGTVGLALGLMTKSTTLVQCSTGPFFAGCHNIALHGFSDEVGADDSDETAGEFDETAGEFDRPDETAGEFDTVVAGDFRNL